MLNSFERLVAFRYLRARRREGFISVIAWFSLMGITLGVATLIVVMSVMNGFRYDLLSRILGVGGHASISAPGGVTGFDAIAARIRGVPGVVSVSPLVEGQVMATASGTASGVQVRGFRTADLNARAALRNAIQQDREAALRYFDEGGVLIGAQMAQRMGLAPGDPITLISPEGDHTAFGTVPRIRTYTVAGTFSVGMYEYDRSILFMPFAEARGYLTDDDVFAEAQIFFNLPDRASDLEIVLTEADSANQLILEIRAAAGVGLYARTWQQTNSVLFNALQVERNVMFLILTLIILVAAFNVISGQIMLVNDKARGIAVLRAMGASQTAIMRIFFTTGSAVGVIGTCAGVLLGTLFAANVDSIRQWLQGLLGVNLFQAEIYYLSQLPSRLVPAEVATIAGIALTLSFLAAIYPAWRAARLDPVEILRYE